MEALAPGAEQGSHLTPTVVQSTVSSLKIHRRRHWPQTLGAVIVIVAVVLLLLNVATNSRFKWPIVGDYLFNKQIIAGAWLTVMLTVVAMVLGILLGVLFAIMRLARNPTLSWVARGYIWFFRGTPLLVQLIFWYNIAALYPVIVLGLPYGGLSVTLGSANVLVTPIIAAVLGLSLNEGAYMAEIIRAGISAIDDGQRDAGRALGMHEGTLMTRVILPQAMRVVIPPTGNEVISMLKNTSLVSVLAISDLLYSAQTIYALNYQTIPLLIVACLWYLALTTVLNILQSRVEEHYGRGFQPRRRVRRGSGRHIDANQAVA